MYYSYLYEQKFKKYFKSKWAHQLLHKFHLNRFSSTISPLFT